MDEKLPVWASMLSDRALLKDSNMDTRLKMLSNALSDLTELCQEDIHRLGLLNSKII